MFLSYSTQDNSKSRRIPAEQQTRDIEVKAATRQLKRERSEMFKNAHWTGKDSDPLMVRSTSTSYCDKWFDPNYRPIQKRNDLPPSNPIAQSSAGPTSKIEKYFDDPANFKGSVKKAVFSERSSNIFSDNQTEVQWKASVKSVATINTTKTSFGEGQPNEKAHKIITDYTTKYKRNPITQEEISTYSKQTAKNSQNQQKNWTNNNRNPITEGESQPLMQKKARVEGRHHCTIKLG